MKCPICSGEKVVWQGNDHIGVMKCVPCPLCNAKTTSKGTNTMQNVDEIQKNIAVPLVVKYVSEHFQSDEFKETRDSDFSDHEKKMFVVMDVYRKVRFSLIERELKTLVEKDNFSLISNKLVELSERVLFFEEEFYGLLQNAIHDEDPTDNIMNVYYGTMNNDHLNLIDVIEKAVDAVWVEC